MLFLTYWFVYFIAALFPVYWACPIPRIRRLILLMGCVAFHAHFAGPAGVVPIIVLGVLTYLIGLSRKRALCAIGIATSIAALLLYKYTTFIGTQVMAALWPKLTTAEAQTWFHPLAAPLAISFFAFEFIHYLIEVRRGKAPMYSLLDFALFTLFWPSIVAGPIKRYEEFLPALNTGARCVCGQDVAAGLLQVTLGLVKKFGADILTGWLAASQPAYLSGELDLLWRWAFVAALSLRILWDFSGYSDMAIGFARMHGICLPANFRWPYLSENLADFWRRWHISLSSWIRDYIYIVLGGNRTGPMRKALNGILAFALCGLWHGAAWHFVVWGLYHGLGLAVSASYTRWLGSGGRCIQGVMDRHRPLAWLLTILYTGAGWLFFFYPVREACRMMRLLGAP
jgi:alginate O-acetyltransferase complex protein AlgI